VIRAPIARVLSCTTLVRIFRTFRALVRARPGSEQLRYGDDAQALPYSAVPGRGTVESGKVPKVYFTASPLKTRRLCTVRSLNFCGPQALMTVTNIGHGPQKSRLGGLKDRTGTQKMRSYRVGVLHSDETSTRNHLRLHQNCAKGKIQIIPGEPLDRNL